MLRFSILFFLFTLPSWAIISIRPVDVGESALGWQRQISTAFGTTRGNSDTDKYNAGIRVQYDRKNSLLTFNADYSYGKANNVKNINKSYIHLRNIQGITPDVVFETFTQAQKDEFQKLNLRVLFGIGPRIRFSESKKWGNLYLGLSAIYSLEKQKERSQDKYTLGSIYISHRLAINSSVDVTYTGYYQPRFKDMDDYHVLQNAQLKVKLIEDFSLLYTAQHNYDSNPIVGVKKSDVSQTLSIAYEF